LAVAALVCAAGLAACDGGGGSDGEAGSPASGASTSGSSSGSGSGTQAPKEAPDAGDAAEAKADKAKPCDLFTPALAQEVLQTTPPAPEMDSPTMCTYSVDGSTLGDSVTLAVEKWQPGHTVQDELDDLGIHGENGQENPQSLAVPDVHLGPDAVAVWDDSSVAVIWKAGDVNKLVVTGSSRVPDSKALLTYAAEQVYKAEQG
jgi:hypothetical protein